MSVPLLIKVLLHVKTEARFINDPEAIEVPAPVTVTPPVAEIIPCVPLLPPLITADVPLSVMRPEPLRVPFTVRFPPTPMVNVEPARVEPLLMVRLPVVLTAPVNVTVKLPPMVISSPAPGTEPVDQVPPVLQLPVPTALTAAPFDLVETTRNSKSKTGPAIAESFVKIRFFMF